MIPNDVDKIATGSKQEESGIQEERGRALAPLPATEPEERGRGAKERRKRGGSYP
jgi:hypothetical protein